MTDGGGRVKVWGRNGGEVRCMSHGVYGGVGRGYMKGSWCSWLTYV